MTDKFFKNIKASLSKAGELPVKATEEELLRSRVVSVLEKKADTLEQPGLNEWQEVATGGGAEVLQKPESAAPEIDSTLSEADSETRTKNLKALADAVYEYFGDEVPEILVQKFSDAGYEKHQESETDYSGNNFEL